MDVSYQFRNATFCLNSWHENYDVLILEQKIDVVSLFMALKWSIKSELSKSNGRKKSEGEKEGCVKPNVTKKKDNIKTQKDEYIYIYISQ